MAQPIALDYRPRGAKSPRRRVPPVVWLATSLVLGGLAWAACALVWAPWPWKALPLVLATAGIWLALVASAGGLPQDNRGGLGVAAVLNGSIIAVSFLSV